MPVVAVFVGAHGRAPALFEVDDVRPSGERAQAVLGVWASGPHVLYGATFWDGGQDARAPSGEQARAVLGVWASGPHVLYGATFWDGGQDARAPSGGRAQP